jgi:hypothetical protein
VYCVPSLLRALIAFALPVMALSSLSPAQAATRTIVYIGAEDCKPCRQWEATHQKAFAEQCAERGVKFRAIRVATMRNIREARYWPSDLRPLLARFADRSGTPHFLAVRNGEIIVNVYGIGKYQREIAPLLQ